MQIKKKKKKRIKLPNPVGARYCGDIRFFLGFYCDVERLRIEIEVTSLYDIFFKHHNDVLVMTQCNVNSCYSDTNFQYRIDIR